MNLYCGCSGVPRELKEFKQLCDAVEYREGLFNPPGSKVLRKWGEEFGVSGSGMRQIWVCWQSLTHLASEIRKGKQVEVLEGEKLKHFGHLQATEENFRIWGEVKKQLELVGAETLLLETPSSFTPTLENKERLRLFVKEWSHLEGVQIAWHPSGFWDREECLVLSSELGLDLVIDPLVDKDEPLPEGKRAYFQLLGRYGLMDSYSDDDMDALLELSEAYEDVTIIFRTQDPLSDIYLLRQVMGEDMEGLLLQ